MTSCCGIRRCSTDVTKKIVNFVLNLKHLVKLSVFAKSRLTFGNFGVERESEPPIVCNLYLLVMNLYDL